MFAAVNGRGRKMLRKPRSLGRRRRTWSFCESSGALFTHSSQEIQYLTSLNTEQTSTHFHVGFRLCLKIHQSERWRRKTFRGSGEEEPNGDSLTDLPFTPSCYTSPLKSPVIMEAQQDLSYLYIFQHQRYASLSALLKRPSCYPMLVSIVLK